MTVIFETQSKYLRGGFFADQIEPLYANKDQSAVIYIESSSDSSEVFGVYLSNTNRGRLSISIFEHVLYDGPYQDMFKIEIPKLDGLVINPQRLIDSLNISFK